MIRGPWGYQADEGRMKGPWGGAPVAVGIEGAAQFLVHSREEQSCSGCLCSYFAPHRFQRSRIQVWLYEQVNMRIEGCIIGFDEYMNLVLDDAEEIHSKTKSRKQLGRIMLKGDNITLLQSVSN
ncbi:PREDICTED: small nuclear ribonucleoprotein E [Tinamus guttatus]|uniref:small nuclear ribonucleoprotein E n=1 Tax=Tinamus guttatus TaxID=94827 RepID=UPI00052EA1C7|nr:PREDICTED: small nuclear ribonucleoprotein E [Tinamus guttatus]